jgi:hypothetical protein
MPLTHGEGMLHTRKIHAMADVDDALLETRRAEALASIAHPDFREDICRQARDQ